VVLNGRDPGFEDAGNELEAVLDTEWAGAVAKGATVKLVASKGTNALAGHDLSVKYIHRHQSGARNESQHREL